MILDTSRLGGWRDLPFFSSATLEDITKTLASESREIYPPTDRVFRALELCQPDDTNVVILGQDPYHTKGKADGLAFSIPQDFGGRLDSLGNILTEMESDLGSPRNRTDLSDLASQGVLLLNTALTVPQGAAKAHEKLGWNRLVTEVIERLSDRPRALILWGSQAQKFEPIFTDHLILKSAHPSPLSAHRGFFGSTPFSTVNQWLMDQGRDPIDWTGQS